MDRVLLARPPVPVPPATRWCLLLMARMAHDETGHYFAGLDWLQLAMGYQPGPSGKRKVLRHLRALQDGGYLKVLPDKRGRRTVYQLQLPSPG